MLINWYNKRWNCLKNCMLERFGPTTPYSLDQRAGNDSAVWKANFTIPFLIWLRCQPLNKLVVVPSNYMRERIVFIVPRLILVLRKPMHRKVFVAGVNLVDYRNQLQYLSIKLQRLHDVMLTCFWGSEENRWIQRNSTNYGGKVPVPIKKKRSELM